MFFARQVFRKRFARGASAFRGRRCRRDLALGLCIPCFGRPSAAGQILQPGFELLDLPAQFLGFTTELHALEFVDLRFEPFDLQIPFSHVLLHLRYRRARLDQKGFERVDIIREVAVMVHAAQFTQVRRGLQHRHRLACSTGLPPVDALEEHRQLGLRQMNLAAIGLRPDKVAALKPFCEQT